MVRTRAVLVLVLLMSCALAAKDPPKECEVRWVGELRRVMHDGDLRGYADLEKIGRLPHLYALGPVEGLRGEITVWDGKPFVAAIKEGKLAVDTKARPKACFLVYAQVEEWLEMGIPERVKSDAELEAFITKAAEKSGLRANRPFPFLVEGKPKRVKCHVINKTDSGPHNHEQHEKAKVKFVLRDEMVRILGFYSDQHLGVFTCGGNLHLHVITKDGKQSGHVDELQLGDGCKLYLPKVK